MGMIGIRLTSGGGGVCAGVRRRPSPDRILLLLVLNKWRYWRLCIVLRSTINSHATIGGTVNAVICRVLIVICIRY